VIDQFFPVFPDADASGEKLAGHPGSVGRSSPRKIVPGHGEVSDGTLINTERSYLKAVQSRVTELKAQGKSSE
jgi:hypothetical protein